MSHFADSQAFARSRLKQLTLQEKTAQTQSVLDIDLAKNNVITTDGEVDKDKLKSLFPHGIGAIQSAFRDANHTDRRRWIEQIQQHFREDTSHGIPVLIHDECLHGVVGTGTTNFPVPIALASTFDPDLVQQIYDVIGREARSYGSHAAHTPVLDLARDPRWGRTFETFGEDTHLVTRLGVAAVRGLQGAKEPDEHHIVAHIKHFAGYAQSDGGRNFAPTDVSANTLYNQILPPFRAAIQEAGALGVMPSHNEISGIPCHGNEWLLNQLLRQEWGFQGIVVTDYYDIERLAIFHRIVNDVPEAAETALSIGIDMDLPLGTSYRYLEDLIRAKPELERFLDQSVERILTIKHLLGLFDEQPAPTPSIHTPQHVQLAQKAAERSITLLKNTGILPLDKASSGQVAVIGPHGNHVETGSYSPTSDPDSLISIYDALQSQLDNVVFAQGCNITRDDATGKTELETTLDDMKQASTSPLFSLEEERESIDEAVALALASDVVILCVGGNRMTGREAIFFGDSRGDRDNLTFPGNQEVLISRILETGTPVIAIVLGSRPLILTNLAEHAEAILNCFYLGEQAGTGVVNCLLGDVNPSGRLPVSIPRSVGQLPVYYSQKVSSWFRQYLHIENGPLYPFGYGLSYTEFSYGSPRLSSTTMTPDETISVEIDITNVGKLAGSEVVQLYVRDCVSSLTRPDLELRAFCRIELAPTTSETVSFKIDAQVLRSYTNTGQFVLEASEFEILIGANCQDLQSVVLTVVEPTTS